MTETMMLRFEAPDWMDKKYVNGEWQHLVGLEQEDEDGTEYYKPVLVNDGTERWWVWKDQRLMSYGPQLTTRERQVLSKVVDFLKE
ncbi:hypothetical protein [Natrinema marinum]|uniref:hypothetical protein n=1 Tax=Natrinema marinum TaxID=2961598 RepID=UPI0020C8B4D2|nr:hypothetical protein [Natrinema marinum]